MIPNRRIKTKRVQQIWSTKSFLAPLPGLYGMDQITNMNKTYRNSPSGVSGYRIKSIGGTVKWSPKIPKRKTTIPLPILSKVGTMATIILPSRKRNRIIPKTKCREPPFSSAKRIRDTYDANRDIFSGATTAKERRDARGYHFFLPPRSKTKIRSKLYVHKWIPLRGGCDKPAHLA